MEFPVKLAKLKSILFSYGIPFGLSIRGCGLGGFWQVSGI